MYLRVYMHTLVAGNTLVFKNARTILHRWCSGTKILSKEKVDFRWNIWFWYNFAPSKCIHQLGCSIINHPDFGLPPFQWKPPTNLVVLSCFIQVSPENVKGVLGPGYGVDPCAEPHKPGIGIVWRDDPWKIRLQKMDQMDWNGWRGV